MRRKASEGLARCFSSQGAGDRDRLRRRLILLCRLADGAEILVRKPPVEGHDPVAALTWDDDGRRLLFGTREGNAGILAMP